MFVHKHTKNLNLTEGQGCQVCETKSAQLQIKTSQNVSGKNRESPPSKMHSREIALTRRTKKQPMANVLNYYNFAG